MVELRRQYKKVGKFTYHVLPEESIKEYLLKFIVPEWKQDVAEDPGQPWTAEWLEKLPGLNFRTENMRLADIRPREDLMSYVAPTYSFARELAERTREREESIRRGVSIEPLLVLAAGRELIDGYTRYGALTKLQEPEALAYVGYDV